MGRHDLYGVRISISEAKDNDNGHYQSFFLFVIEFSQLYHAEWIDQIRDTSLGGLVLGYGFYGAISTHIQSELPPAPP